MMNRYFSNAVVLAAVLGAVGVGATGCNEDGSNVLCSGAVYDPASGVRKDYGANAVGKKVNAMLDATSALVRASGEIDTGMLTECTAMAMELGIPGVQLEPLPPPMGQAPAPGARTKAACERVAQEIKTTLNANLMANAFIDIKYKPAVCTVDINARLACVQTCETMIVTQSELMCKPGKFYFPSCEGTCSGSCEGSCSASCTGSCSAECNGACEVSTSAKCTGTCYIALNAAGKCDGMCSVALGADGTCAGRCAATLDATGVCKGTCSTNVKGKCEGTCTGSCSGTCKGGCTGSCMGGCRGGCTAGGLTPPVCEEVFTMREERTCETSCNAEASCKAMCTVPSLTVVAGASINPVKVELVVNVVKKHYGAILRLTEKAFLVSGSAFVAYRDSLNGLASKVGEAGVQAGACMASAVSYAANAIAAVQVSASVSVSVSASVSASGNAGGAATAQM